MCDGRIKLDSLAFSELVQSERKRSTSKVALAAPDVIKVAVDFGYWNLITLSLRVCFTKQPFSRTCNTDDVLDDT